MDTRFENVNLDTRKAQMVSRFARGRTWCATNPENTEIRMRTWTSLRAEKAENGGARTAHLYQPPRRESTVPSSSMLGRSTAYGNGREDASITITGHPSESRADYIANSVQHKPWRFRNGLIKASALIWSSNDFKRFLRRGTSHVTLRSRRYIISNGC